MRRFLHVLFGFLLLCGGLLFLLRVRIAPAAPPSSVLQKGARRHRPERLCAPAHLAMVLVPSSDAHRRQLIRETWAHPFHTRPMGLGVAFGVSAADSSTDFEAEMFGDIILLQEREGVLSLLQAAREACRRPEFLVKVEEDFFVNAFALVDALHELQKRPLRLQHHNAIWCHVWEGATVVTANDSGWFLSLDDSATSRLHHCLPGAFVMGTGAADALLLTERSNNISQTIIDDVFVTGELARGAGVDLVQMAERYDHRVQTMDERRVLRGQTIFARIGPDWEDGRMEGLWNRLAESRKESGL